VTVRAPPSAASNRVRTTQSSYAWELILVASLALIWSHGFATAVITCTGTFQSSEPQLSHMISTNCGNPRVLLADSFVETSSAHGSAETFRTLHHFARISAYH